MGQVWLAQQTPPVRRTVALKLIKAGMGTDEIVARFAGERQALATMEHPAIARVYDAGSTPDQQPFFAMEFVDGAPITEFCDRRRLSIADRIALFIQVCEGVRHAHQKAIIHRDLKPSNVLVAEQDGHALPKIIDFGLAKAMQADAEATQFTQVGMVVGTPVYMSPEQAGPQAVGIARPLDADARAGSEKHPGRPRVQGAPGEVVSRALLALTSFPAHTPPIERFAAHQPAHRGG
jgi:non-specific serine/threonine protein kinase/serine/threonine-protein kinase